MAFVNFAKSALSLPSVFGLYQRVVGAPECHRRFLETFAKPCAGERVIDLGCGTGASLAHLPEGISYVGVDIDSEYIRGALARFGDRGTFLCSDLVTADLSQFAPLDLAISFGVLHHLNDDDARAVLEIARGVVRPGGRLVTIDPCYVRDQSPIARFLNDHDRGRHIRDAESYRRLFAPQGSVETAVLSDMLRVPYTMIVATLRFD
jgi:SAM-dependent methyltransferase